MRPVPTRRRFVRALLAAALLVLAPASALHAQQAQDAGYSAKIREYTTEPFFLTPLVDYLPESGTVPTTVDVLGHVVGQPDVLHYPEEIYEYMRAVDEASDRVKVFSIGDTEEGREMLLVVVADEATIANLEQHKANLGRLADPRATSEAEAQRLIGTAKPIYWATGAIHSPETGSPEMLMELVYRLAVDEGEHVRTIRDNLIFMATPVVEVDGRAKVVDLAMAPRKDPDGVYPTRPLYWGKYVAHDNNRDGMALQLALTRNIVNTFNEWHPTVLHDLHESASYLYTSTGRGPYNAWIDPIVINEWNRLAYKEVKDMTAWGVPGIYTFDFYDGWAPNYMFWVANMRNAIGRFYETQASRDASTHVLEHDIDRQWHRPNTPLPEVVWGIRNNVNLQQSALLIALHEVAVEHEEFLRNFWEKSKRAIAKATTEGPAAYVLPASDPRPGQQARLLQLLQRQGAEVHRATSGFTADGRQYAAGSYVLRMDQPYSRAVDMLLDKQYYNPDDPRPYDDVGWTLGPLYNAQVDRIEDVAVLDARLELVAEPVQPAGRMQGSGSAYLIDYNADNNLTAFRFANRELRIDAAEQPFDAGGRSFRAGSFILRADDNPGDLRDRLERAAAEYGFTVHAVNAAPSVPSHAVAAPRIAVVHTWQRTQDEGWLRLGLDEYGVPHDYISVHDVRDNPRLRERYDVLLLGPTSLDALSVVRGVTGDQPIPWKATSITPNIGRQDETDDMRGGLELAGVMNLQRFVEEGGTLVTLTSSASVPVHFGFVPGLAIRETNELWAPGGVYRIVAEEKTSPLLYGYDEDVGVYFNQRGSPVFGSQQNEFARFSGGAGGVSAEEAAANGATTARRSGRGGLDEEDIVQARPHDMGAEGVEEFRRAHPESEDEASVFGFGDEAPAYRTILRYSPDVASLLISGGLDNGGELANTPALVQAPLGRGNIVMFSFNPFWRGQTLGSYAMLFNALLHHGALGASATGEVAEQQE